MVVIDKLDALKLWLVKKLTPMCDADPNALAKYVVALVKKDKSEEELIELCIGQLEVFLQKETNSFVDELFATLKNKSYCEEVNPIQTITGVGGTGNDPNDLDEKEQKKPLKRRLNRPSPIRHRSRSPYDRRRRSKRSRSPRERRRRSYRSHSGSPKRNRTSPKRRSPIRRSRSRSRSPYRRNPRTRSLSSSRSSSRSPDSSYQKPSSSDDRSAAKKKRCWDYDQKGFCILGDNCPYDHGKDPVVVEDSAISSTSRPVSSATKITPITAPPPLVLSVKPPVLPPPPIMPPPPFLPPPGMHVIPPPGMRLPPPPIPPPPGTIRVPPPGLPRPPTSQPPPGYNPEAPGLTFRPEIRPPVSSAPPPLLPGLVNHPPPPILQTPIRHARYNVPPGGPNPNYQKNNFNNNTKLVIRKIPPILNNITKLNEHFSKFGAINNIQVKFENDPQCALIEYAHVNSARAAKRDTGAVMNNRFIMVYWYNPQTSNGRQQQPNNIMNQQRTSVKERLGALPTPSQLKYTAPGVDAKPAPQNNDQIVQPTITRTISNPDAAQTVKEAEKASQAEEKARQDTKVKVQKAKQAAKEKLLARQKIMLKKKIELQKQKRELLDAQMEQQKLFLNKIKTSKNMPPAEKLKMLESLKTLTASIDKLRTSLKGEDAYNSLESKEKQMKTQKEVLDAELDLYNASTTGESTLNLKRKLSQLKVEASSLGLVNPYKPSWGRGRGRGGYVPRPKVPRIFSSSANLDRRPRELRVSGFHDDEKDELISHLSRFGEIESFSFGDGEITCTVKFQTRAQAEIASLHGPTFKNRRLIIVWTSGAVAAADSPVPPSQEAEAPAKDSPQPDALVVPPVEAKVPGDEEDDDDEADNVNVHIGEVSVNYPVDLEDDLDDHFDDEIDEDALLAADFDDDVDDQLGDDYEDEIRSWRR